MADTNTNIVIVDGDVQIARTIAATLSPVAGANEFRVGLRAKDGKGAATHWITSGWLNEQFVAMTKDADALYGVCRQYKLPYTRDQLAGIIKRSVVRSVYETDALALLDELDLEVVPPPEEK